jgi:hypothetical protein
VGKIVELSNKNFDSLEDNLKEKFTYSGNNERKLYSTILSAGSIIAVRGRIGPPSNILISEENYKKYELKSLCESCNYKILFDDSVNDLFIYRKNNYEQPGLILSFFENKYELVEVGFNPEKHFMKIILNK